MTQKGWFRRLMMLSWILTALALVPLDSVITFWPEPHWPDAPTAPPPGVSQVFIGSSGQRLVTLFDGLPPNQLYSWGELVKHRRKVNYQCGSEDRSPWWKTLLKTFSIPTVNANCIEQNCAGSYWVWDWENCYYGGEQCYGTIEYPRWDPGSGSSCGGTCQNGANCGSIWWCGCHVKACNSCGSGECPKQKS